MSTEKTRVVNVKRNYSEFLGFKIKVHKKGQKHVVTSHISDNQLKRKKEALVEQAKRIAKPRPKYGEIGEIHLYNLMVIGMQNYYCIATEVNSDCQIPNRTVMTVLTNRLYTQKGNRLVRVGRKLTKFERDRFGKSKMLRYVAGSDEPIYPIGYVQHKNPMNKKCSVCCYTTEGRKQIHDNLRINVKLMLQLMAQPLYNRSAEYADNRISLFSAQWGKCAVTGKDFTTIEEIHCHHKLPRSKGGTDEYNNLVLIMDQVHRLLHASKKETIEKYKQICNLDADQMKKLNNLRRLAGYTEIA